MLTQKQYDILQLIDERTRWDGDVRPGIKLTCYFNPSKRRWSEEKRDHVNIGGSGDAAIIRGLWNKGYAKQHGPLNPYSSVITQDGMLALEEYRNNKRKDSAPFGWEPAPQWAKDAKDADVLEERRNRQIDAEERRNRRKEMRQELRDSIREGR